MAMIGRFWLQQRPQLPLLFESPHATALATLIQGQLLMSCRYLGGYEALERGFTQLQPYLAPADYFLLLKRHQLLKELPTHRDGLPPQSLSQLLQTAMVIRQLSRG